jgi:hypothetical protein
MKVIGFSGAIGSGKDTCCEYIYANHYNVKHLKFSHPIQDIVATMVGEYKEDLSHRQLFNNRKWKEEAVGIVVDGKVITIRDLMKGVGEGYRDLFGEGVWSSYLDIEILSIPDNYIIVVSDVRKQSDAEWIKSFSDSTLVYIQNDKAEDIFYEANPQIHRSESHLPIVKSMADVLLFNNFELNYLYDSLDKLI